MCFPASRRAQGASHLFDGTHSNMTPEMWKQLPEAMTDPIAVLDTDSKDHRPNGDVVFMVEIRDKHGATVVVPVVLGGLEGRGRPHVNILKSAYTKNYNNTKAPRDSWFIEQI